MLGTFHSEYEKLEITYSNGKTVGDHVHVIKDCGVFIERCIKFFIQNFHISLQTSNEREKYLTFEKTIRKPVNQYNTVDLFVEFLNKLAVEFPSHKWIKPDLAIYLDKADTLRNKYADSKLAESTDDNQMKMQVELESDDMIYYAQKIMLSFGFKDKFIDTLGFSLSNFLVYTSIKEKFNSAYSEIHYQQIIHDAHKILPNIITTFLNKIYTTVNIDEKEQIIKIIHLNKNLSENDSEIEVILSSFIQIDWKSIIPKTGEELISIIDILLNRPSGKKKSHALRFISVMDILINFLKNEELSPILIFANKVKKKYLENGNIIEEADKAHFNNITEDLHIQSIIAENIINRVINTIEKKIIIFQTFHKEKTHTQKVNVEKEITNLFKYACLKLNDTNFTDAINDLSKIIKLKSKLAFYYIYRGIAYEAIGEDKKANNDFKLALEINPKHEFYFYNKGLAKLEANDYEGAIVELDNALKYSEKDSDIYYYKGEAFQQLGKLEKAIFAYKKALEISPEHSGAAHKLEKIRKNTSFIEQLRQKKKNISAHFNYACKKLNDKEYEKAITDFDLIIEIEPKTAFYYIYRGVANELINNLPEAEKDFQYALTINSRKDFYFYNRGLARTKAKDYLNALKEFDQAISLKSDEADYYFFRAVAYEKLKNTEQAKINYQKTLEINPRHTEAPRNIEKISFKEQKRMNEKISSLYISNLFRYVCSKFNDTDFEEALNDLNEIISLKSDAAFYYVYRGITNELLDNTQAAHLDYTKALELNSAKDFFHFNKGIAFFEARLSDRAIRELNTAIHINNQVSDFYFYKALVYENAGEIENAILACNQTLELFPGHREAKRRKSKLLEKQLHLKKIRAKRFLDSSNANEFFENARFFLNESNFEQAINELDKASGIMPNVSFYYIYKGIAFEKMEDYNQADKNYKIARGINSDKAMFRFNKAKAEFDIGNYKNALSEINKALEINEKFAFINYRMKIFKKLNKTEDLKKDEIKSIELQRKENLSQKMIF